ncbi:dihydrolipoyllysine-residue succinyltransferase component of 2-oxoglutarate dehydrogenase complex [Asaia siamensis]|uniref:Dihydrolipoyllysine-residue succinyltransferase component of 2-oxoglutarate dehydrogenase complex n=2 Tax=Asaia siamensis TaxID=110479 RepID=A0ABQ1LNH0_9PROT|nr:2-oxoglutarate dehydrogenase E2 component [Asaia siamensis NRIC 0323]GGC26792.1 dihydrolipoyllysine-residue succinyltransferase component of 2-oxoglutarate dehydrogenase complex [Asaia siamensis]
MMSVEIRVPVLGESVTSATITRWLKQPGQAVAADEPVVELETDKISVEVPAPQAGVLGNDLMASGAEVAVGSVLGTLDPNGKASAPSAGSQAPAAQTPAKAAPAAAPQAPQPARDPMPAAARLMAEEQIAPGSIAEGTGLDGRVTKGDVIARMEQPRPAEPVQPQASAPAAASAAPAPAAPSPAVANALAALLGKNEQDSREQRVPMTRLRQTIARRLKDAQNTAAILTTFNEVDMSAAKALRAEYREVFEKKHGVKLGFMSIFARACIKALQEFPAINSTIDGDDIIYRRFVNLGIAVGSERGLVVPVLHDADQMSFAELERHINDYGSRARAGTLKLDELSRGTFSITNGGVFGSLLSTPILNPPQSAILGMHAIQDRPVAVDGQVVIRPMMYVALSYDHRMVDGREAVSFLVRVKQYVEDPRRLLLDV